MGVLAVLGLLGAWIIWSMWRIRRIVNRADRWAEHLVGTMLCRAYTSHNQITPWSMRQLPSQATAFYHRRDSQN